MNKIYPVGVKGKLQRWGWVQGRALPRREIEKLWLGQEKEDQGVLGGTKSLATGSLGTVARLHHSHGRLAVNCLSQSEMAEGVANPGINRTQLHSEFSFVITMFRGLYNV